MRLQPGSPWDWGVRGQKLYIVLLYLIIDLYREEL